MKRLLSILLLFPATLAAQTKSDPVTWGELLRMYEMYRVQKCPADTVWGHFPQPTFDGFMSWLAKNVKDDPPECDPRFYRIVPRYGSIVDTLRTGPMRIHPSKSMLKRAQDTARKVEQMQKGNR